MGRDFTLYARIDGVVKYESYRGDKRRVRVEPVPGVSSSARANG
jgi:ribosomal protein L27